MLNEISLIFLSFIVAIISATFGFGGAIILIPIATMLLPIKKAIVIVAFFFLAVNINKVIFFWKHINWNVSLLIWIGAIPFAFIGAYLMNSLPSIILYKILGIMILLYLINEIINSGREIKLTKPLIVVSSFGYGFFAGVIGTGDVIKAALLTHIGLTKERFIATMGITALAINITKISTYSQFDIIEKTDYFLIASMMVSSIIGSFIGRNFIKKINDRTFKIVIYTLLAITGFKMLFF